MRHKEYYTKLIKIYTIWLMISYLLLIGIMVIASINTFFTPPKVYSSYIIEPEPIVYTNKINEPVEQLNSEIDLINDTLIECDIPEIIEPEYRMEIDDKTYEVLLRVVEAEVTGSTYKYNGETVNYEDLLKSKIRVAQVFMNRVEDTDEFKYINDLHESLTYPNASSTFNDGRYYKVTITDITKEAVELSLLSETPDYTDGALYFKSGTKECKYGSYLFTDSVGHSFYK